MIYETGRSIGEICIFGISRLSGIPRWSDPPRCMQNQCMPRKTTHILPALSRHLVQYSCFNIRRGFFGRVCALHRLLTQFIILVAWRMVVHRLLQLQQMSPGMRQF
uniref:(northern house mosquito) hypothetical protein n=1 Tax=Culex pipiens TaxID=7175 RepID=A0A8D8IKG8_CULPI